MRKRLTDSERDDIVKAYSEGYKVDHIASQFGVDPSYPGLLAKRSGKELRWPDDRRVNFREVSKNRRRPT